MNAHITSSDVTAFHDRRLDRARIESIGAHVRECEQCARLLWNDSRIAESAEALWSDKTRSRRWLAIAAAVAAALAIIMIGVAIRRPRREPQIVRVERPSSRVVRDGNIGITLDANGAVRNVSTPRAEWNALVASALRSGVVSGTGALPPGEETPVLRGEGQTPRVNLLEPLGVVVESDRPRFRWTGVTGARYRVLIARDEKIVMKSALQTRETWMPDGPLPRGAVYAWQLTVVAGAREWTVPRPDAPSARFRVLAESELRELDAARATKSRLLIGVVAARFGLGDLAARELTAFASEHHEIGAATALAGRYERPAPTTTNGDQ